MKQYINQIYSKLQIAGDTRTKRVKLLNMMESVGDLDTAIKIENRNQQLVKAFNKGKKK